MTRPSIYLLTLLFSFSLLAPSFAGSESPFTKPDSELLRIDFFSRGEFVEIKTKNEIPKKVSLDLITSDGSKFPITSFDQDGPSTPQIASVFKSNINTHHILFLIVRWHYYLPGVDTDGYYYEVHAYRARENSQGISFFEDQLISKNFGDGFEGKKEGKLVHFPFKDAASIRKNLPSLADQNKQ